MKSTTDNRGTEWLAAVLYGILDPVQPKTATGWRIGQLTRQGLAVILSAVMIMIPMGQNAFAQNAPPPPAAQTAPAAEESTPPQAQPLSADQLDQLVAPIALYPDALLAQVLAASTYPTQVVEADRWRQSQGNAPAEQVAAAADGQNWDPSVKALTAFPTILEQMDHNLQWTTDLGNAYYNQPQDVMDSVQAMRQKAEAAGNLRSTPQETVNAAAGGPITIAPANPTVVYVPVYDPWAVYGYPFPPFPGYYYYPPPGIFFGGLAIGFGIGIGIGFFSHWGWGWGHWGVGWGPRWGGYGVRYNHGAYFTHSTTVINHGFNRPGGPGRGFGARGAYARPAGRFNRPGGAVNRSAVANRAAHGASRPAGNYGRPGGAAGRPAAGAVNRVGGAPRSAMAHGPAAGGGRPAGAGHPSGGGHASGGHSGHSGGGHER